MCSLRFSVTDDKGDLIGQRVLPLSMIRSGYRFVTLRDKHSQPLLLTSLFVFVRIENYIPDHLKDYVCDLQRPPKRIVDDDGKNPNSLSKVLKSRTTLTTLMIDDDLPTQVKKRNIPAIKPGELVVTNSKRMLKFNKRAEKECGILERNYKTRLSQAKSKPGLLLRRSRSLEPVAPKKDFDAVKLELEAKYRQEMRELQIRLTEERYKETASVLYLLHEEQKKTMSKIHDKELATYQKTVISGYYDQISAKKGNQKKKMGEASMKHIRLEVAKKCTEKIQQLKDLHAEELKRLATTQSKLQEQLRSDKEQDLKRYQSAQH
ncbi:1-phosphatidylinositol 4,5-bisphosphate phosphodiesterase beta-1-like [Dysidea avara]|uniref:1-phosphatidylinositol 4,5-bisphosphate phosphodiesterase beta-1-like n=1 Tax=Dysidea avara TaxID=196820 RepID=UPI003320861C